MAEREIERWVTWNGRRIPIFKGESKEDVVKRLKEGSKKGKETTKKQDVQNRQEKRNVYEKADKKRHQKFLNMQNGHTSRRVAAFEKANEEAEKARKEHNDAFEGKVAAKFTKKKPSQPGNTSDTKEDSRGKLSRIYSSIDQKKKELNDYMKSGDYQMIHYKDREEDPKRVKLEQEIKETEDKAWKLRREMQSKGLLPKYSQDRDDDYHGRGVILESTVTNDPRYEKLRSLLPYKKYQAGDMLRNIMYAEEEGRDSFKEYVPDFMGGDRSDYTVKTAHYKHKPGEEGYSNFGEYLRTYKKAYRELGWKATTSENEDSHRSGYHTIRGGYQSASHTQARTLTFEKIPEKPSKISKSPAPVSPSSDSSDATAKTATRLRNKGFDTPESIEKHLRGLSPVRRNRIAQELGVAGRGDEKINAMTKKIYEAQGGKSSNKPNDKSMDNLYGEAYNSAKKKLAKEYRTDNDYEIEKRAVKEGRRFNDNGEEKSWQDKDEEIKQKQIANAEKQKAERNNPGSKSLIDIRNTERGRQLIDSLEEAEEEMRGRGLTDKDNDIWVSQKKESIQALKKEFGYDWEHSNEAGKRAPRGYHDDNSKIRRQLGDKRKETKVTPIGKTTTEKTGSKFNAKERASYLNNISRLRNGGDRKNEDWRVARQMFDQAPTGTVMISKGERGSEFQYKKLADGSWEYIAGAYKGDKTDSKTISMGWAGRTGYSPSVEFTTEKAMKAKEEKARSQAEAKMKKAANLPNIKSNKSVLTRSGDTMYLDLDPSDMSPSKIKELEKKGWKRRGLGNGTWYYGG